MLALGRRAANSARETQELAGFEIARIAAKSRGEQPPQILLFANAEFLDYVLVALGIVVLEVVQQATSLADHHQETAAGGVILFVRLKVVRQFDDPLTEHRDLNFGTTSIVIVGAVSGNDVLFSLSS
jgi:hypothetical protein